jgi:hypothetical protein
MSQNTPIESFASKSKIDRTGEALGKVWVANTSASNMVSQEGPFQFTGANTTIPSTISNLIESCKDRLFISTSSFSDSNIIQAVEGALSRSVRIYMLVDTKGFNAILSNSSCGAIIGNVLLRERKQRGLDLIISDWHLQTAQGFLLTTPLDGTLSRESKGWALDLDKNQIDELSRHVQHEFWTNKAPAREVLSADEAQSPVEIAQAPAALSSLFNGDYVLRSDYASDGDHSQAEATLLKQKAWEGQFIGTSDDAKVVLHGKSIELGSGASQTLHSSPRRTEPSSGHFAHSGISLQLAIGTESYLAGWDRTANGDWHSILRLTAEQAKAAKSLLQKFSESPEWIGHSKIKLGDAGDKIIRNGTEMDITDSQSQDLGVVHLAKMPDSIKELQEFQPALDLPEDSLARECEFKWIAAPPVLPTSASEDALHKEWKDAKNEISKRLKALDESNVVSKIPGFGRKAKELKKTILELTATVESIDDPKSLSDMIDNVEKLTEAVGGNLDAMKAAEDEEARQKLEDKQRAAHNAAVEKANKTIKDLEPRLKKRKTELDKLKKAVKKAKDVEKSKLESDIETLSPKIKQLDAELSKAKLTRSAKFEFKAPATLSSSKKKGTKPHKFLGDTRNSKLDLSVPKEGLPQFGTLYEAGTERYLAVSDWTHVAQGRKDAKRLKATLCAPREVLK